MDQDQSGSITCNELYKFIVKVAKMENNGDNGPEIKWEDVKKIFKSLDKDGDRNVEWEEFFVRSFAITVLKIYKYIFRMLSLTKQRINIGKVF